MLLRRTLVMYGTTNSTPYISIPPFIAGLYFLGRAINAFRRRIETGDIDNVSNGLMTKNNLMVTDLLKRVSL